MEKFTLLRMERLHYFCVKKALLYMAAIHHTVVAKSGALHHLSVDVRDHDAFTATLTIDLPIV